MVRVIWFGIVLSCGVATGQWRVLPATGERTSLPDASARAREAVELRVDSSRMLGKVPVGIVGLSQGGGMADYDAATAQKLREGGFKWFRMDNVLTNAVKRGVDGKLVYDWTDLDRRV